MISTVLDLFYVYRLRAFDISQNAQKHVNRALARYQWSLYSFYYNRPWKCEHNADTGLIGK